MGLGSSVLTGSAVSARSRHFHVPGNFSFFPSFWLCWVFAEAEGVSLWLWLSCPKACGILSWFLDQGSSPYLLHQKADSLPLVHQGSPLITSETMCVCKRCETWWRKLWWTRLGKWCLHLTCPRKPQKYTLFTSSWEVFYHLSPSYHNLGLAKKVIQFFSITAYGKTQKNFLASPNII